MENILELKNVSKTFPGVKALQDVRFELKKGEIHALMGENGAGKSTFIKIITGVYQPDSGGIIPNRKPVSIKTPPMLKSWGLPPFTSILPVIRTLQWLKIFLWAMKRQQNPLTA